MTDEKTLQRDTDEIEDVLNRAPAMADEYDQSYGTGTPQAAHLRGVEAGIRWLLGEAYEHPLTRFEQTQA